MNLKNKISVLASGLLMCSTAVNAQLNSNPDKFLGNITTSEQVDWGKEKFYQLWDQITPENETKWDAIEGSRGVFTFTRADRSANYAKQHHFPFKYHTLIWGGQYPGWMNNISTGEQYSALNEYFDGVKEHYPNLEIIDVVNEAIAGHNPAPYRPALGGEGRTGYDWIIKAFEMAHERWPNAILVYNDYNTFRWQKTEFINLVRTLRDAGAPIDAYGCQSHDVTDMPLNEFQSAMSEIQDALKIPMYSTEFDVGTSNDQQQLTQYKNLIPVLWESDYCAGVTLWGYIYGHTWTTDGNSGLIREDGTDRPAMEWLRKYMQSDAAKNAKSPFPGLKKEASIYVHPAALKVVKDDVLPIKVRASMATKTIEKIDLYVNDEQFATLTEAPYITEYSSSTTGWKTLKAVVTTTDGSTYERLSRFQVVRGTKREPYNDVVPELPGTIKADEYDKGASGVSYSNVTRDNFTTTATKDGAWMEYTVDVKEDGLYIMEAEIASTNSNGMLHLSEYAFDDLTFFTNFTEVPNTGSKTQFQTLRCPMLKPLTAGRHALCLNVDKGGFYIKSLTFKPVPTVDMPGVVEMEDFATCSDGVVAKSGNGGTVMGNTTTNATIEYTVNISQAGKYSYEATVSSAGSSSFRMALIESDGNEKTLGTVSVPQTGSLDTYEVKTGKIRNGIKAGKQTLRVTFTSGNCNIDKINFICTEPAGITEVKSDDAATGVSYNLAGQKVGAGYKGIVIRNGKKVIIK